MITLSFPLWLLYLLGGILFSAILFLAVIGAMFLWAFKDGIWH